MYFSANQFQIPSLYKNCCHLQYFPFQTDSAIHQLSQISVESQYHLLPQTFGGGEPREREAVYPAERRAVEVHGRQREDPLAHRQPRVLLEVDLEEAHPLVPRFGAHPAHLSRKDGSDAAARAAPGRVELDDREAGHCADLGRKVWVAIG